jgi:hypothetical protein
MANLAASNLLPYLRFLSLLLFIRSVSARVLRFTSPDCASILEMVARVAEWQTRQT